CATTADGTLARSARGREAGWDDSHRGALGPRAGGDEDEHRPPRRARAARQPAQARATHGPQPPTARAMLEARAADRRRPDIRRFRAQPGICKTRGNEADVPALAGNLV